MDLLYDAIDSLYTMSLLQAIFWVSLANIGMFAGAIVAGNWLVRVYSQHRVSPPPAQAQPVEWVLAIVCLVLNALVAVAGLVLWREDLLKLRPYGDYGALTLLLDVAVLILAMDLAMYLFHRVAHLPLLFPIAHRTHHLYENPRPLSLFVLNPLEVLGFGALWLVVVVLYHSSIEALLIYLAFNLIFGMVGHLGVEPMPARWLKLPLLRYVSTSTFHAEHHMDFGYNYGFYTLIWDRLFGTLSPDYVADFDRATGAIAVEPT